MGTSTRRGNRLRVLVEAPAPYSFSVREAAAISHCEIAHCAGPLAGRDCPILGGKPCAAVDRADVVVANLGLDSEQGRLVLAGLKELHPDVPLVVLAWQVDRERHGDLLEGCHVVTFPWTLTKLRFAIRDIAAAVPSGHEASV